MIDHDNFKLIDGGFVSISLSRVLSLIATCQPFKGWILSFNLVIESLIVDRLNGST